MADPSRPHDILASGERYVLPEHGPVEFVATERRRVMGPPGTPLRREEWQEHDLHVFRVLSADRREVVLPCWRCASSGVRRLLDASSAQKLLDDARAAPP